MFRTLSFKGRITALVVAAMVAVLLISVLAMVNNARQLTDARREVLVATIDSAHSTVASFVAKVKAGKMDEATAKVAAAEALLGARYGKDDYFYIWTMDGVSVLHPFKPEWKGQSKLGQIPDGKGGDVLTTLIGALKASPDGKAFVETHFPRPGQTVPVLKLQYLKAVPEWGWMVGTGLYMDDLQAEVRAVAWKGLVVVGTVMLVLGALATRVARDVLRQIGGDPVVASQIASEVARTEQTSSNLQQTAAAMDCSSPAPSSKAPKPCPAGQQLANGAAARGTQGGGEVVSQVVSTMDEINSAAAARCRHHRHHRRHCLPDQHPGAERRGGSRPCRRAGPRLCRGGQRGAQPGRAQRRGGQGDQAAHRCVGREGRGRFAAWCEAGSTMQEIVASVQRVTDMIGEITAPRPPSKALASPRSTRPWASWTR
jgi:hypothetical protein